MNDYYGILGVNRDSSEAEIKKAYRQLARKLHPDIAGHSKENEEQFKKVQNAYEVLSNSEKRQMYDMGHDPLSPNSGASPFGFGADFGFAGGSIFEDVINMFSGGAGTNTRNHHSDQGRDVLKSIKITLEEAIFGVNKTIAVNLDVGCEACEETGSKSKSKAVTCATCRGQGVVIQVRQTVLGHMQTQSTCPTCKGRGDTIVDPCDSCRGLGVVVAREKIDVEIPKGVRTGNRIAVKNKGNKGSRGGASGDLYLEVSVREDETFSLSKNDLLCKLEVPLTTALLGGEAMVKTFDGDKIITIDSNTAFGNVKRIANLGFPTNVNSENRGDIKVFIEVIMPSKLNKNERDLVQKLGESLKDSKHKYQLQNIENGGFFDRLKKVFI